MWSWLASHDAYVVAMQLGIWLVLALGTAPRLIAELRGMAGWVQALAAVCSLAAIAICAFWFPTFDRFVPLGHEASYSECLLGESTPSSDHGWQPYVTYPLLRWGYWALGGLFGREDLGVALAFNMVVRGVTVGMFAVLAKALFRSDVVAAVACVLLLVHPTHAFWGTGIYNVAIPCFFVVLCMLQAVLAWRTGDRWLLAAGAASGCLVVATRVEWGILAPSLAILLFGGLGAEWGRHQAVRTRRYWVPALVLVLVLGLSILAGAGALTTQGGYHDALGYFETMARQAWILDFLTPLHTPWGLALVLGGVLAARSFGGLRPTLSLLAFVLLSHCALATFNDFAYRHDLLPGFALLLVAARGGEWLLRGDWWGRSVVVGLLLSTLATGLTEIADNVQRYYATVEEFEAGDPGFQLDELSHEELENGACYLITDNERLWSMGLAGSHFNLMEPGEAATHWRDHDGCIYWLFDFTDWRVDGLAVRARALKLRKWFSWEAVGHASFPDGNEAVVYRMTAPPWGLTEPPPNWRWGDTEVGGDEEQDEVGGDEEQGEVDSAPHDEVGGDEEQGEVDSAPQDEPATGVESSP